MSEKTDEQIAAAADRLRDGKGIIMNCDLGFMITVKEQDDGRMRIEGPIDGYPIRGSAEADYVREAISAWSAHLAEWDKGVSN